MPQGIRLPIVDKNGSLLHVVSDEASPAGAPDPDRTLTHTLSRLAAESISLGRISLSCRYTASPRRRFTVSGVACRRAVRASQATFQPRISADTVRLRGDLIRQTAQFR